MVINSDIVFDIDLKALCTYHQQSANPVTMVMHDYPAFNSVSVNSDDCVARFAAGKIPPASLDPSERLLAFTGIQVLDPLVLDYIPPEQFYSSIDAYSRLIDAGFQINAYIPERIYWRDIGTPASYLQTVFEQMAASAFPKIWPESYQNPHEFALASLSRNQLKGDGSDRKWSRVVSGEHSLIMVEHGIAEPEPPSEAKSFLCIGDHLLRQGVAVPQIYAGDAFAGLMLLEDLGDISLQAAIQNDKNEQGVILLYQQVIDQLVTMHQSAAKGFDTAWTYQSACYDPTLILEKECRYFLEAFVRDYGQLEAAFQQYEEEFNYLAENALKGAHIGFMHRDLQSRNIMICKGRPFFIDFQGGRLGPIQYDLASLLIDPYVNLPEEIQQCLLTYGIQMLSRATSVDPASFKQCYAYCALARNLQMLGAFGYLSHHKQKSYFKQYIPIALKSLAHRLDQFSATEFKQLKLLSKRLVEILCK
jgi:aminoglycoside/choline kinase family phosphotransferase